MFCYQDILLARKMRKKEKKRKEKQKKMAEIKTLYGSLELLGGPELYRSCW